MYVFPHMDGGRVKLGQALQFGLNYGEDFSLRARLEFVFGLVTVRKVKRMRLFAEDVLHLQPFKILQI